MIDLPKYNYSCELERVVDGDTIDLVVDLGFYVKMQIRVRLLGVDAPEVRGKEGRIGDIVTDRVRYWLRTSGKLSVQTTKTGKYGRWLGVIYRDGADETLNEAVRRWTAELMAE